MYEYLAQITKVVDGDTLHVRVDLGLDTLVNTTVRLYGIDCPERFTDEGKDATQFVADWLTLHAGVREQMPLVLLRTIKDRHEKYGRYLATVHSLDGSVSLVDDLRAAGHEKRVVVPTEPDERD